MYLYNREAQKEQLDFNELNSYIAFLKKIKVNKSLEFDEKFAYLKLKFNNFEDILRTIYDKKPIHVKGNEYTQRIIACYEYNSVIIEAVYASNGELITVFKRRSDRNNI